MNAASLVVAIASRISRLTPAAAVAASLASGVLSSVHGTDQQHHRGRQSPFGPRDVQQVANGKECEHDAYVKNAQLEVATFESLTNISFALTGLLAH